MSTGNAKQHITGINTNEIIGMWSKARQVAREGPRSWIFFSMKLFLSSVVFNRYINQIVIQSPVHLQDTVKLNL